MLSIEYDPIYVMFRDFYDDKPIYLLASNKMEDFICTSTISLVIKISFEVGKNNLIGMLSPLLHLNPFLYLNCEVPT